MSWVAFSIKDNLSKSDISICSKELSKLTADRYFHIILLVVSLGSNLNSGLVWWAKWKSSIEFSDMLASISSL